MKLPIYQVDAFSSRLFAGNPAAVVPGEADLPAATMQAIAAENNLSETAFVFDGPEGLAIRWFTPTVEVDLCGHATLAAAHVLFEHLGHKSDSLSFASRSGPLLVKREAELLWLDFPADQVEAVEPPAGLAEALGLEAEAVLRGRDDYLVLLQDEASLRALQPDMAQLAKIDCRGVIVSCAGEKVDFVSRFFAPRYGVPEDPVTGSAHTSLIPYWSRRLNKNRLQAWQVSQRGGQLHCENRGERVGIGGQAVTYLIGEITLP